MLHKEILDIISNKPEFFREAVILLGLIELCKVTKSADIETLINLHGIKADHWWPLLSEITDNEDFENIATGEVFSEILKNQLWMSDHDPSFIEGSVLDFLNRKKK
jgi:hypothetical protein